MPESASNVHAGPTLSAVLHHGRSARPDSLAIVSDDNVWTWSDVDQRVQALAGWLLESGARPGDVIAWQAPNLPIVVPLYLACWQVGAVAAPLAGILRDVEVDEALTSLGPVIVATVAEHRGHAHAEMFEDILRDRALAVRGRLLLSGRRGGWTSVEDLSPPTRKVGLHTGSPVSPVVILQTSGSTGRSKAVVHGSEGLIFEARHSHQAWGWTRHDRSYAATTFAHMASLLRGIILPAAAGSPIVMRSHWDSERAARDLVEHRVSFASVPGLLLQELVDAYVALGRPHHVRVLSAMAQGSQDAFAAADALGLGPISNYGSSEYPTVTDPRPEFSLERRLRTAGPPSPGTEIYVRNDDGSRLDTGQVGELCVRGPEQMLGYSDAVMNSEVWHEGRWLRTGDIGRIDADGDVVVVGRIKDIINRGGEKFSAAQIEDVIRAHACVDDVAVIGGPDARLGEVPVAFIQRSGEVNDEELSAHVLRSGLATQKVPTRWEFVDHLPRTASGKIAKGSLRDVISRQEFRSPSSS